VPFNLTGHPVVVIPVGRTQDGLPIGMQIVGKRWQDMELLAISQEIDQIVDAFQRPSDY
jgi:amidase